MVYSSTRDKIEALLWSPPPEDPKERKLVRKLDAVIMPYICLAYFINYLDRANLANAYVSGMQEAVGFKGNDYTYANSMYSAGFLVGMLPNAFIFSSNRIPPRFWLPFCMACFGLLCLGQAFTKTPQQVWGIRFVQAIFESSTFCGTHYLLGTWYKDAELGKRSAIFINANQFATLISGVLQGAIVSTLEGRAGLAGWQWLFVIDFIMTVPIVIFGFVMFPDTPETTNASWLSEEERVLCLERLPPRPHVKMTGMSLLKSLKHCALSWRWYLFSALFGIGSIAFEKVLIFSEFPLWLKSTGTYTTQQVNYYPCIAWAVAMVANYIMLIGSDYLKSRWIVNVWMFIPVTISCAILLKWNVPTGAHMFAYILGGFGFAGQASNFTWCNELCRDDEVLRSVTLFSMNLFSQVWLLWYAIVVSPVSTAPQFKNGQIGTIVTGFFAVCVAMTIEYCSRRWPPAVMESDEISTPAATNYDEVDEKANDLKATVVPV